MIKRKPAENAGHPSVAALPGTCLTREHCATCIHFVRAYYRGTGRCWLAAKMRGLAHRFTDTYRTAHPREWWHGIRLIAGTLAACKHWQAAAMPTEPADDDDGHGDAGPPWDADRDYEFGWGVQQ